MEKSKCTFRLSDISDSVLEEIRLRSQSCVEFAYCHHLVPTLKPKKSNRNPSPMKLDQNNEKQTKKLNEIRRAHINKDYEGLYRSCPEKEEVLPFELSEGTACSDKITDCPFVKGNAFGTVYNEFEQVYKLEKRHSSKLRPYLDTEVEVDVESDVNVEVVEESEFIFLERSKSAFKWNEEEEANSQIMRRNSLLSYLERRNSLLQQTEILL